MKQIANIVGAGLAIGVLLLALAACEKKEGPAERAGKEIDKSIESAGQQLEKAGQKIQDAAKDAKKVEGRGDSAAPSRQGAAPNKAPTPAVSPMANAPQNVTRMAPVATLAPPTRGGHSTQQRQEYERRSGDDRNQARHRDEGDGKERHRGADGEARRRRQRRLHRPRAERLGNAELVARVRTQRVVGHQLLGNLLRERVGDAAADVDRRQLPPLALIVGGKFTALQVERGLFGIGLRADRNVLARRHRHRARDEAGDPRDHHAGMRRMRRRDPEHQACGRNDAIVGAQHRRAQPADAVRAMSFAVAGWHVPVSPRGANGWAADRSP